MKVKITESYAGELDGNPAELRAKMRQAADAALQAVQGGTLRKGQVRGGEIAAIDELAEIMTRRYEERMAQLRAEWTALVDESGDPK